MENNGYDNGIGGGIFVHRGSILHMVWQSLDVKIRKNIGDGITIVTGSTAEFWPEVQITENKKNGIFCGSASEFIAGTILIQNNDLWGIWADNGSMIDSNNSTISDNISGDIKLEFGSRATLNGNTIGSTPITCDSTVLSRGDTVCP